MKTIPCLSLILCLGCAVASAGVGNSPDVKIGDSYQQMVDKIGKPQGVVSGGRNMTCYFERGTVDLVSGRVEKVLLVTAEEAKDRTREREQEEARRQKWAEAERNRLTEAGRVERDRKLADKEFAKRPGQERLDYWNHFAKQYPYTDVSAAIADAEKASQAGLAEREKEAMLAAVAKRVDEIQARFAQLDADYAASLANWKRTEIDAERAALKDELATLATRVKELTR